MCFMVSNKPAHGPPEDSYPSPGLHVQIYVISVLAGYASELLLNSGHHGVYSTTALGSIRWIDLSGHAEGSKARQQSEHWVTHLKQPCKNQGCV